MKISASNQIVDIAKKSKIKIHEPFADFLHSSDEEANFEISLLDCYHLAGHACHSMTGAFLVTQAAVEKLFPESKTCERGDVIVEFGSEIDKKATGPRSNVISYITGAWGETGFPGLKGQFSRKNLISYGHNDLKENEVRFRRISNGKEVIVEYNPSIATKELSCQLSFPESWREEIFAILKNKDRVVEVTEKIEMSTCGTGSNPNGCS
ncbi:MAG: hypothetical protein CL676_00485 [Bdellovibrionaceae bacterium]|nr:hypothetical protein [Pseudobdellovibrionaceae bacterium]|tara:strand:+ start:6991 stop:7617 length:627 start_codon:yes stop_codon:yes gene_type:complete